MGTLRGKENVFMCFDEEKEEKMEDFGREKGENGRFWEEEGEGEGRERKRHEGEEEDEEISLWDFKIHQLQQSN